MFLLLLYKSFIAHNFPFLCSKCQNKRLKNRVFSILFDFALFLYIFFHKISIYIYTKIHVCVCCFLFGYFAQNFSNFVWMDVEYELFKWKIQQLSTLHNSFGATFLSTFIIVYICMCYFCGTKCTHIYIKSRKCCILISMVWWKLVSYILYGWWCIAYIGTRPP